MFCLILRILYTLNKNYTILVKKCVCVLAFSFGELYSLKKRKKKWKTLKSLYLSAFCESPMLRNFGKIEFLTRRISPGKISPEYWDCTHKRNYDITYCCFRTPRLPVNGSDKLLAIGRQRGLAKGRENALAIGRTCAAQGLYCRCSSLKFMSKGFANVFTAIASNQGVGIRAVNRNCKQHCRVKKYQMRKKLMEISLSTRIWLLHGVFIRN